MNHSEIQDLIPLLALGGLADTEQAELEKHLATCPSCRALLTEYAFVAEELEAQVPQHAAPAQLESKLMQRVPARPAQPKPEFVLTEPNTRTRRTPVPPEAAALKPGFWQQRVPVARWAFAFVLLALLLSLGVSGALALQVQRLGAVNTDQLAQLFASNHRKFVELDAGTTVSNRTEGYVYLSPTDPTALLWFNNLKPLDANHAYQVWLRKDGQRISGGLFHAGDDGHAMVVLSAPNVFGYYTDIGVTVEPVTGSPGPTTPRVIGGKLD